MEIKAYKIIARGIASNWVFVCTMLLFAAETGWLALTSRFPMAFDEAYHFNLIQFFAHRLNPVVTSQTASTYKFGAIVQNPSFLYHYLLSFPDRFVTLFTYNPEPQVIVLRLINIAFALGSLYVMKKLLRLLQVPDGLANILLLIFALTPIVTVLSAQINYDNLFILSAALCVYQTVFFAHRLNRNVFDTKALLVLLSLCLFSSLVKFAFLPILLAIAGITAWKIARYRHRHRGRRLLSTAAKNFAAIGRSAKLVLLTAVLIGSLLFVRFYGVNLVKYHNPAPQCSQILSFKACKHYYAWDSNYNVLQYQRLHPTANKMNTAQYSMYWLLLTSYFLFGATMPLQGPYSLSDAFYLIIILLTALGLVCTIVNFRKMLRANKNVSALALISFTYLLFLWGRNYHDYVHLGQAVAVNGRYWVPVLFYLYTLAGLGVYHAFSGKNESRARSRSILAVMVIAAFVYYGGYMQYMYRIDPVYGGLKPSNNFILNYGPPPN